MSLQILQTGIAAVQAGNKTEGARLLRIALKSGELTGDLSAIANLWLAETTDDPVQKRGYYNDALTADPTNADARQRLATMLASQLPPSPAAPPPPPMSMPEAAPAQASRPTAAQQVIPIIGGPNGPGTAFYVSPDGLLATTRYVTGGLERITVEVQPGRQVLGQVVRAFPEFDLTFIRIEDRVSDLLPITQYPRVPDEAPLSALAANRPPLKGRQRATKRVMAAHWIPTDFLKLNDAGGDALFDEQNYLVGMLTKNSSRASGYLFGVHITAIRRCADLYRQETQGEPRIYCPGCGVQSLAMAAGYFFCEVCGSVAPQARQFNRYPQEDKYGEVSRIRCTHCGAQVGFHGGRCLRCGHAPSAQPLS